MRAYRFGKKIVWIFSKFEIKKKNVFWVATNTNVLVQNSVTAQWYRLFKKKKRWSLYSANIQMK